MIRKTTPLGAILRNRTAPALSGAEPDAARGAGPPGGALARLHQVCGFTLVELLIAVAVIGALAAIAIPNYKKYIQRAQIVKTVADLKLLENEIALYFADHEVYPASLADIGRGDMRDLWGNPYQYTNISLDLADIEKQKGKPEEKKDKDAPKENSGVGKFRSYLNTKPINTDFDIYSMGPDGKSARPLTSKNSYDDIIRGNNGGYMGVAKEF